MMSTNSITIDDLRKKISVLEWDLQFVKNQELRKIRESQLENMKIELARLKSDQTGED